MCCLAPSKKERRKKKNLSKLNHLASKIDDKMGARAPFSRSHLNISFRIIDLFCVTYPDPFFVIKRERVQPWCGGLSVRSGDSSWCACVYTLVRFCVANE